MLILRMLHLKGKFPEDFYMGSEKKVYITKTQFIFLIQGILIGTYIFRLPNLVVKTARQDAWLTVFIGLIYPLYVLILGNYIIKKHPDETILQISRKYIGKLPGNILNFIFSTPFIILTALITVNTVDLIHVYGMFFINPAKITFIIVLIAAYTAYFNLRVQGKINEIMFIPTALLIVSTIAALNKGSILNMMPFFETSFKDIIKGSKDVLFSFLNIEVILLIHPFFKDKKSIKKLSFTSLGIVAFINVWVIFISIFYLGADVVTKNIWPYVMVSEGLKITVVNNFKTFFLVAWNLIQFKIIGTEYFFCAFSYSDITGIDRKKLAIYLFPLFVGLSILFLNSDVRRFFIDYYTPVIIVFNILYITLIGVLIAVKKKTKS